MSADSFDVIVVGAGPGGTASALHMRRAGLEVLLVDRAGFPRDKVCGDHLGTKALRLLNELGLDEVVRRDDVQHAPGVRVFGERGDGVLLETRSGTGTTVVCARRTFDQQLLERARTSGVTFWSHARVDELLKSNDAVRGVRLTRLEGDGMDDDGARYPRSEAIEAPIVIGADGAYSVVARELRMPHLNDRHHGVGVRGYFRGIAFDDPVGHLEVHFLEAVAPGFLWLFPLADGLVNMGVVVISKTLKDRGIPLKDILFGCMQHPRLRDRLAGAELVGTTKEWGLPFGSRPREMAGNGWMLVGDAAALVDPIACEGVGNAMLSGKHAAAVAAMAVERRTYTEDVLQGYRANLMKELSRDLKLGYAMQRMGSRKRLLNRLIRKSGRSPELAKAIGAIMDEQWRRRYHYSPLFYLRMLMA